MNLTPKDRFFTLLIKFVYLCFVAWGSIFIEQSKIWSMSTKIINCWGSWSTQKCLCWVQSLTHALVENHFWNSLFQLTHPLTHFRQAQTAANKPLKCPFIRRMSGASTAKLVPWEIFRTSHFRSSRRWEESYGPFTVFSDHPCSGIKQICCYKCLL